jgi:hypothetical protein
LVEPFFFLQKVTKNTALLKIACAYILGNVFTNFNRRPTIAEWSIATILIALQPLASYYFLRKKFVINNAAWILSIFFTLWTYSYEALLFQLADWHTLLSHLIYLSTFAVLYYVALLFINRPLIRANQMLTVGLLIYGSLGVYDINLKLKTLTSKEQLTQTSSARDTTNKAPNIYLFLLDAYANQAILKRDLSFDNAPFIDSLKQKNFHYFTDSRSNYTSTIYSLTSFFIQDSLPKNLLSTHSEKENRYRLRQMENILETGNTLASNMKNKGYNIVNLSLFNISGIPPQYPRLFYSDWNSFWIKSLYSTFYGSFIDFLSSQRWIKNYTFKPEYVERQIFNDLDAIVSVPSSSPRFVYLHSLAIHSPFYNISDPNYKTGLIECLFDDPKVDKEVKYINAVESLNKRLLKSVNQIITHDENAVVLILSDHGARVLADSTLNNNFMAVYNRNSKIEDLNSITTPIQIAKYLNFFTSKNHNAQ